MSDFDDEPGPFWDIELRGTVVLCRRTARPYLRLQEIDESYAAVQDAYAELDRSGKSLLVDLRAARGRNDPAFESVMSKHRRAQLVGFARAALLVRSRVGQMQVERHMREDGLDIPVFAEEREAFAYIAADAASGVRKPRVTSA
jgi:hypothetical protein